MIEIIIFAAGVIIGSIATTLIFFFDGLKFCKKVEDLSKNFKN
jgi:hypothetical protein